MNETHAMIALEYIIYAVIIFWICSEFLLTYYRRRKKPNEVDPTTKIFLFVIYSAIVISSLISFLWNDFNIGTIAGRIENIKITGAAVIILGMMLRWYSIVILGKYFTANITILENHVLFKNKIYKYIRHPSYLGAIISYTGFGIFLCNWISLAILVVAITSVNLYRIKYEEKLLLSHFGDDYKEYMKKTKKFIPFLH
jgi:protein-S-isoprenylcysteine O-methyltransferase Ste14